MSCEIIQNRDRIFFVINGQKVDLKLQYIDRTRLIAMIKFGGERMITEMNTMINQRLKNHIKNIQHPTIRAELYEALNTFKYDYEFDDKPEL